MYITDLKVNTRDSVGYVELYLSYKDIKTIADVFFDATERSEALRNTAAVKDLCRQFTRLQVLVKTGDLDLEAEGLVK